MYLSHEDRLAAEQLVIKAGFADYFPNGLSPPTSDIVKRRYELTRSSERFLPYQIRLTSESIQSSPFSAEIPAEKSQKPNDLQETIVVDEVLDYEDWMSDPAAPFKGRTMVIEGTDWTSPDCLLLLQHPSILVTEEDQEEDSIMAFASGAEANASEMIAEGAIDNRDTQDQKLAVEDGVAEEEIDNVVADDITARAEMELGASNEQDKESVAESNGEDGDGDDDDDAAWMKELEDS